MGENSNVFIHSHITYNVLLYMYVAILIVRILPTMNNKNIHCAEKSEHRVSGYEVRLISDANSADPDQRL